MIFFLFFFSRGHQGQALPWVDGSIFRFATLIDLTKLSSLGFGGLGRDNYSLMESQVGFREQGQRCCCQASELCKQCRRSRGGWTTCNKLLSCLLFIAWAELPCMADERATTCWGENATFADRGSVATGEPLRPFAGDQFDFRHEDTLLPFKEGKTKGRSKFGNGRFGKFWKE